jgi:MoxR-like ATPase
MDRVGLARHSREENRVPEETAEPELKNEDLAAVERLKDAFTKLRGELSKVIVGQHGVLEELLVAIFARGHCLLIGVPGLAKTLMIHTLSDALSLSYNRVQFTPDLMPSDITGTEVIQEDKATGTRQFKFLRGPIFANMILADEINRTPPKTQAALLEAMQERQVTVGGERHRLPDPFFVLATQNPIEQEGTYPLPEAQLDRFMLNILVDYPDEHEEYDIVRLTTSIQRPAVSKVLSGSDILELQEIVRKVPVADHVARYAVRLVRLTRRGKEEVPNFIRDYVSWGAGPRASQYLVLAAKARAVLFGRYYVSTEDIRAVAFPVLRHRIITNFNAEAEGLRTDDILERLIAVVPVDEHEAEQSGRLPKIFKSANVG